MRIGSELHRLFRIWQKEMGKGRRTIKLTDLLLLPPPSFFLRSDTRCDVKLNSSSPTSTSVPSKLQSSLTSSRVSESHTCSFHFLLHPSSSRKLTSLSSPLASSFFFCTSVCIRDAKEAFMVKPRFPDHFVYLTLDISDHEVRCSTISSPPPSELRPCQT